MVPRLLSEIREQGTRLQLRADGGIGVSGASLSDAQRAALRQHRDIVLRILGLDSGDLGAWQRPLLKVTLATLSQSVTLRLVIVNTGETRGRPHD